MNKRLKKETQDIIDSLRGKEFFDRIIYLGYDGSIANGTNNENSDIDLRGIILPSHKEIFTLKAQEKPYTDEFSDTVLFPLKQVMHLLAECNPNVLNMLGTKPEHVMINSVFGEMIRENQELFLSQQVYNTYGKYAINVMRNLKYALGGGKTDPLEKEQHIKETLEFKIDTFHERYQEIDNKILLNLLDSNKSGFEKEICINLSLENYPIRDLSSLLKELSEIIRDYDKLKQRNKKSTDIDLYKHAMSIILLLLRGKDILEGKGIVTYREDRNLLLDIRQGKYAFEEIFEMAEQLKKEMVYAKENSSLPLVTDKDKINELTMTILEKYCSLN